MSVNVTAEFQDRKRVLFTARGRSTVNVRELIDGEPIGYSSTELLLVALGNCTLGTLLNHPLLKDEEILHASVSIDAESADAPPRVSHVTLDFDLEVANPALLERQQELAEIASGSYVGNSLTAGRTINLRLRAASPAQPSLIH